MAGEDGKSGGGGLARRLFRGGFPGKSLVRSWLELFRGLGQSFLDLLRAEWEQLLAELGVSGKKLAIGAACFAAAAAVGFWLAGVFTYFLIQVIAIWLPAWAAAGVVVLVLLLLAAGLAWWGWRTLHSIENPVDTVGRRLDDHLDWWEAKLVAQDGGGPGGADYEDEELP